MGQQDLKKYIILSNDQRSLHCRHHDFTPDETRVLIF